MTERSYEDAVQALKRRFGGRWEGLEADGRDEMVDVLEDELGFDHGAANDVIDAMIQSGQLRYHRPGDDAASAGEVAPVVPAPAGTGATTSSASGGFAGTPIIPVAAHAGPGHWQIGREEGESGAAPGRAGQVDPTA
jgi:hypothetical protein